MVADGADLDGEQVIVAAGTIYHAVSAAADDVMERQAGDWHFWGERFVELSLVEGGQPGRERGGPQLRCPYFGAASLGDEGPVPLPST
jgi:hypothetical protein